MSTEKSEKLNLKKLNWNKLDLNGFSKLSETINESLKLKKTKQIKPEKNKIIVITIDNKTYKISYKDYVRYKSMKSTKTKEKFKQYVVKNYEPILAI